MNFDLTRYDRQIALPQIDLDGQESLSNAHIIIVGVGGLGCAAAQSMALMGVGQITLIDPDTIDKTNLPRQPLYNEKSIGKFKVDVAKETLTALNPNVTINSCTTHFYAEQLDELSAKISMPAVVLDCTDNLQTRLSINAACVNRAIALVVGAAIRFEGMVTCILPGLEAPCYECLSKVWPDPNETCVERGVFGPVVSLMGHYQALLAGQVLMNLPVLKPGKVQFFDGLTHSWNILSYNQALGCTACAHKQ